MSLGGVNLADERQAALDAALKKIEKILVKAQLCVWVKRLIRKFQPYQVDH